MLHLSAVALEGIIGIVERTDSLNEDQDVLREVSQVAQSLVSCMQDLNRLAQDIAEEFGACRSE